MVNLISNSCVGAYITTICLDQPYVNPFCWNIIDFKSFKNLIEKYNSIDFKKIKLTEKKTLNKYSLTIDGLVTVLYEHYIKSEQYKEVVKKNCNVYYKDIDKYIISKYNARLKLNKNPIFLAGSSWPNGSYSCDEFKELILTNKDRFRLIIIVNSLENFQKLKIFESKKTKIYYTKLEKNNKQLSLDLYSKYKDFINE